MKTKIVGVAMGIGALWLWAPGCSQPETACIVGTANASAYVAKFTLVDGDPESACGAIQGDLIGLQQYNPPDGDVPDTSVKYLAIQTSTMGSLTHGAIEPDPDETHKPYSLGTFNATEPDSNALCTVPTLSPAQLSLPEVPPEGGGGGPPDQEAIELTYEWSNVNIYVSPALPGNQMEATLKYTEDGCSATYHVVGLWPAIGCEKLKFFRPKPPENPGDPPLESCNPCGDPSAPDTCVECDAADRADCEVMGSCEPEPKLCDDEPDKEEEYQIPYGSGIAPDLQVACDPDLLMCVLNSRTIPALK